MMMIVLVVLLLLVLLHDQCRHGVDALKVPMMPAMPLKALSVISRFAGMSLVSVALSGDVCPAIAVSGGGKDYATKDIRGMDFTGMNLAGKDFTPVSYTHLTLPTIYSV